MTQKKNLLLFEKYQYVQLYLFYLIPSVLEKLKNQWTRDSPKCVSGNISTVNDIKYTWPHSPMLDGGNASAVVILATVSLSLLTVDLDRSLLRAPISPWTCRLPSVQHVFISTSAWTLVAAAAETQLMRWHPVMIGSLHAPLRSRSLPSDGVVRLARFIVFFLKTGHRGCWQALLL